jgi:hypothetical protein
MHPNVTRVMSVILWAALCGPAAASVIRDNHGKAGNPSVEAGGHPLLHQAPPPVRYSLIGAIADRDNWLMRCALWPWRALNPRPPAPRGR